MTAESAPPESISLREHRDAAVALVTLALHRRVTGQFDVPVIGMIWDTIPVAELGLVAAHLANIAAELVVESSAYADADPEQVWQETAPGLAWVTS